MKYQITLVNWLNYRNSVTKASAGAEVVVVACCGSVNCLFFVASLRKLCQVQKLVSRRWNMENMEHVLQTQSQIQLQPLEKAVGHTLDDRPTHLTNASAIGLRRSQTDTWSFSKDGIDRGWHDMALGPKGEGETPVVGGGPGVVTKALLATKQRHHLSECSFFRVRSKLLNHPQPMNLRGSEVRVSELVPETGWPEGVWSVASAARASGGFWATQDLATVVVLGLRLMFGIHGAVEYPKPSKSISFWFGVVGFKVF